MGQKRSWGHKYGISPKSERTIHGIVFHSKREMRDYLKLSILEEYGKIANLQRQVRFKFKCTLKVEHPDDTTRILITEYYKTYVADFTYEQDGITYVHETKGKETKEWLEKKKWFEALYPQYRLIVA
jgi:hypothetical protein